MHHLGAEDSNRETLSKNLTGQSFEYLIKVFRMNNLDPYKLVTSGLNSYMLGFVKAEFSVYRHDAEAWLRILTCDLGTRLDYSSLFPNSLKYMGGKHNDNERCIEILRTRRDNIIKKYTKTFKMLEVLSSH